MILSYDSIFFNSYRGYFKNAETKKEDEVLSFFEKAVSEERRGKIMTIANSLQDFKSLALG